MYLLQYSMDRKLPEEVKEQRQKADQGLPGAGGVGSKPFRSRHPFGVLARPAVTQGRWCLQLVVNGRHAQEGHTYT